MKNKHIAFIPLLLISFFCSAKEVSVDYVGTGKSWWDVTTFYNDPNTADDYALAFDGDSATLTKEAMFKRNGGIDERQGLPVVTAFNFDAPFSGIIRVFMDFRTSPQGISDKELFEVGGYYLSFMCSKTVMERKDNDVILRPDTSARSYMIKSEEIYLADIPDNGLAQGFQMNVEECHGLMLREMSTSMISIDEGRLNSYVIFRRIRDVQFILEAELDAKEEKMLKGRKE